MSTKQPITTVRILKQEIKLPFRVDIIIITTLFLVLSCINSQAQNQKTIDSLNAILETTQDFKVQIDIARDLHKRTLHFDKEQSFKYIQKGIKISEDNNDMKGLGTAYADLGMYYRFDAKPDSSRYYYKKGITTLNKMPPSTRLVDTYDNYGTLEALQGNMDLSIDILDQGYNTALNIKDGYGMASLLKRKGSVLTDAGEYEKGSNALISALRILDTLKKPEPRLKGIILGQTGRIEMIRNNYKEAQSYFDQSLSLFNELDNSEFLALTYNEIGNLKAKEKKTEEALENFTKALPYAEKIGMENLLGIVYANISKIQTDKGNYKEARQMLDKSMILKKKNGSLFNIIIGYNEYGRLYSLQKDYTTAIQNHTQAIKLADSTNTLELLLESYIQRSDVLEMQTNYKAALQDYKKAFALNDTLNTQKYSKDIDELRAIYNTEKKEKEIAILRQKEEATKNKQRILILLLGSLALLTGILIYAIRQKIRRGKAEKEIFKSTVEFKEKELTTHALHLAHKNEVLLNLKSQLTELKNTENASSKYQSIINNINLDINGDNAWDQFRSYFEDLHKDFNTKIMKKYPEISNNDLRLMSLLKMNLSSKEIAHILNISNEGVKKARYRLRKKMNLTTDDSLQEIIIKL
jgi:tetratricopeptide (TPR) repeat protein/DNA-binding CsgD family transcriptional regulator